MAWDDAKNHSSGGFGFTIEWGTATLAAGTVEVPTRLAKCHFALAGYAANAAKANSLYCDGAITSGAITVADQDVGADDVIWYLFLGWA
jgi:hypothetical protein